MNGDAPRIFIEDRTGAVESGRLRSVVEHVLHAQGVRSAEVDVSIVGDAAMRALNRRWLDHDFPTDVLSFHTDGDGSPGAPLEGQVVLNPDYAAREAAVHGWSAADELALYLVHGLLHLCGYDDREPADRRAMREREAVVLAGCGIDVPAGHAET